MEMLDIIAGLAWDPEIRGFLAVLTGVVVLPGSVWLVVSTNTGPRLGTLIALSAFFGWMTIMASVWWIYGIGYAGDSPVWEEVEIIEGSAGEGDLGNTSLDEATDLHTEDLPSAHDIVVREADALVEQYGDEVLDTMSTDGLSNEQAAHVVEVRVAWAEYGIVTAESLTADQIEGLTDDEIEDLATEEHARNEATTLSELAAVAPGLIEDDAEALGGWTLLSTAESGEAQTSAIAMILESGHFDFGSQNEFKVLDAFTIGGKRGLPDDPNRWDRISTQIRSAVTIKHPTRYGIIQVQRVSEESITNLPGTAPKRPEIDPTEPVVSVIMIRNLGNLRLVPALITIGSLLIFLGLCYMMHERDKLAMARRASFEEVGS